MIWRMIGLVLMPVLFIGTLVLTRISLLPETVTQLPQLHRQELIVVVALVAYAFFAATWGRSIVSRIAVVLLQIAMAFFLIVTWFARI